jgi:hypothetical protein
MMRGVGKIRSSKSQSNKNRGSIGIRGQIPTVIRKLEGCMSGDDVAEGS